MIITRAPLRITLGGGGTDVKEYYERHGGLCLAAAIDKYVYIAVHRRTDQRLVVKYSRMEDVGHRDELQHPIIREALKLVELSGQGLEIVSFADIPAGTGLGSSGAFTVALLKALHALKGDIRGAWDLAEEACAIEIDILKEPIGKQDQYIAAYGGSMKLQFKSANSLGVDPAPILPAIEDSLLLFFTGCSRSASEVLQSGNEKLKAGDEGVINKLHRVKQSAQGVIVALEGDAPAMLGALFHDHWTHKRQSTGMTNATIDAIYDAALPYIHGGKLVGAGGGGFFLFVASDKAGLRKRMKGIGVAETRFRVDYEGVKLV
jgi:D-glycero-alpha-D-manno-heptose-7-phosphate kinase